MAKRHHWKERVMTKQLRQGDVLLELVDEAKAKGAKAVKQKGDRVILAYGEATGHHHAVPLAEAALLAKGAERFLRVPKQGTLSHEEHGPIRLPSGTYEVTIQREYAPGEIRNVLD